MMKKLLCFSMLLFAFCFWGCGLSKVNSEVDKAPVSTEVPVVVSSVTEPAVSIEPVAEPKQEVQQEPQQEVLPAPEPNIVTITINAVGDVTLGNNQKQTYKNSFNYYYDKNGKDYFLKNVKDIFEADDFTVVNLEGTLTESEDIQDKLWNHKGRPEYVQILTEASVEAVTLGNNHIMDYGEQGITDTIQNVEDAGLVYAMSNEWGHQVGLFETAKGILIGVVSVNQHYDGSKCYPWLEDGLNTLRELGADFIIACPHWGPEKTHEVSTAQQKMGRWCIDAGYDVVLGSHAHMLQGIELYNGRYIVYCMGNFCYGGNKNPEDKDSMIWQQKITWIDGEKQPETEITVIPCRLSSVKNKNDFCPVVLEGEEAEALFERLNTYCELTGTYVDSEGKIHLLDESKTED